ncbi:MAG: CinA family protein [Rickettsiales bacterium]
MPFNPQLLQKAEHLLEVCRSRQLTLATAESCTGGLVAALLTEIPGSSDVFLGGAATYSNKAKHEVLRITNADKSDFEAVSERTASEMAQGACTLFGADASVALTGIAGPGGGSDEKPVGTVHIATCFHGTTINHPCFFKGDRHAIRMAATETALDVLLEAIGE